MESGSPLRAALDLPDGPHRWRWALQAQALPQRSAPLPASGFDGSQTPGLAVSCCITDSCSRWLSDKTVFGCLVVSNLHLWLLCWALHAITFSIFAEEIVPQRMAFPPTFSFSSGIIVAVVAGAVSVAKQSQRAVKGCPRPGHLPAHHDKPVDAFAPDPISTVLQVGLTSLADR